ncbi:unnamed protein product, partial [Mesorhabditis belari]|uniref:MFS transporter n=1 Tax=Mesorhabditis belari TaxID=2138241 RepID=A0AAF3EVA3_9BILA
MKEEISKFEKSRKKNWMELNRELFGVLQLGLGFFFIFAAFNSQAFIVLAIIRNLSSAGELAPNDGYYSKGILYFTFMFSNLLAPPVISRLGSKWAMVIGASSYMFYLLCFLDLKTWIYFTASALNGIGAAILWTANGVFLVEISKKENLGRNSSVMWTVMQTSLLAGASMLALFLGDSDLKSVYRLVYTVFSVVAGAGVLTLALLPRKRSWYEHTDVSREPTENSLLGAEAGNDSVKITPPSIAQVFVSTFKLAVSKKMRTLLVVFFFLGIESTFSHGIYPASVAATGQFADRETILPYLVFAFGTGVVISGLILTRKKSALGNKWVVLLGTILMIAGYLFSYLILPAEAALGKTEKLAMIAPNKFLFLIPPFLLGLGDSCWQTQVVTLVGGVWRDKDSAPAFACFKFFQAGAACFAYVLGAHFLLHYILAFIILLIITSTISFFLVHNWAFKEGTQASEEK